MAGVSPDGRHLYPAFPYPSYARMSLKDVRDLYRVPANGSADSPGERRPTRSRFRSRFAGRSGFWKLLYMPTVARLLAEDPSEPEARGRYLVEGPGHCGECHSPRTFLGGLIASRRLTGAPLPDGKGKAPNITANGLADWSESDIAYALSTGLTPSGDSLGGPMAAVVRNLGAGSRAKTWRRSRTT